MRALFSPARLWGSKHHHFYLVIFFCFDNERISLVVTYHTCINGDIVAADDNKKETRIAAINTYKIDCHKVNMKLV